MARRQLSTQLKCECNPRVYSTSATFKQHFKSARHRAFTADADIKTLRILVGQQETTITAQRCDVTAKETRIDEQARVIQILCDHATFVSSMLERSVANATKDRCDDVVRRAEQWRNHPAYADV